MAKYAIDKDYGYIKQTDFKPKIKDTAHWGEKYNSISQKSKQMSWLRHGLIHGICNPGILLDIGFGNGDFLNTFKDTKTVCYGSDLNSKYLPKQYDFIHLDKIFDNYYNVVTMFDVIEHMPTPEDLNKLMCTYLVISTPYCKFTSMDLISPEFMKWRHRRPNEHCSFFNLPSLEQTLYSFRCIYASFIEDSIRKNDEPNVLTCVFKII